MRIHIVVGIAVLPLLTGCGDLVSTGPVEDALVASVEIGQGSACAVNRSGAIACRSDDGTPDDLSLPVPAVAVTVGLGHACALDRDGGAWCWGDNSEGQLGRGSLDPAFSAAPALVSGDLQFESIDAGGWTTCGVTVGGDIWCWGSNAWGTLGYSYDAPPNGCEAFGCSQPVRLAGNRTYSEVSLSMEHACALAADGGAWCWGNDQWNQLGTGAPPCAGDLGCPLLPGRVIGEQRYVSISAGSSFACAIATDGAAWCWGEGAYGQLGTGEELPQSAAPVAVATDERYVAVTAAAAHACAITRSGRVSCWGGPGANFPPTPGPARLAPVPIDGIIFEALDAASESTLICGVGQVFGALCWTPGERPVPVERHL